MAGRIPKVVVIGPSYVDMAVKCSEFPDPGQMVEGSGFSCSATGSGVNEAVEAALCGCETYLVSKVGDDPFGQMIIDNLQSFNVKTDFVYTANAISTGIIVTFVDSKGENSSCKSTGANRALADDEVACATAEQLISSADVCMINGDMPRQTIVSAISLARMHKTKTVLEAKMTLREDGELNAINWPVEFFSADVLVPDFGQTAVLAEAGSVNVHKLKFIASELMSRGIGCVVIRMGSRGTLLSDWQGSQIIDSFEGELVDQSGCSDAFCGALTASCGTGDKPETAVKFANAAYALARSKFGSQDSLPTKEEIIELLQKQGD